MYIIKWVSTVTAGADPGGSQGSEDPTKAPERGLRPPPPPCHNNVFTIANCERFNVTDEC